MPDPEQPILKIQHAWNAVDHRIVAFYCAKCKEQVEKVSILEDFDSSLLAVLVICHGEETKYKFAVEDLGRNLLCFKPADIMKSNA
jgi:hypothetical protein